MFLGSTDKTDKTALIYTLNAMKITLQKKASGKYITVMFTIPPWIVPGVSCLISMCINNPHGSRVSLNYAN